MISNIIKSDIMQFVLHGGFGVLKDLKKNQVKNMPKETIIQKTLQLAFENSLQARGLRSSDIRVIREAQHLNNKRTDFIISYGIIGNVMVEVKLAYNMKTNTKAITAYRDDFIIPYKSQFSCAKAIYLIFNASLKEEDFDRKLEFAQEVYSGNPNIEVVGLNL